MQHFLNARLHHVDMASRLFRHDFLPLFLINISLRQHAYLLRLQAFAIFANMSLVEHKCVCYNLKVYFIAAVIADDYSYVYLLYIIVDDFRTAVFHLLHVDRCANADIVTQIVNVVKLCIKHITVYF